MCIIFQMSEQSIENKQRYLRENILEQGYDAQDFMGFCEQNQGQIDLDGWSFAKLQKLVQSFINGKQQNTFTQQQLDNDEWTDFHQSVQQAISQNNPNPPKVEPKKQLVFSEADWGIFGLQAPKIQQKKIEPPPPSIPSPVKTASSVPKPPSILSYPQINQTQVKKTSQIQLQNKDFSDLKVQDVEKAVSGRKIIQAGQISVSVIKSKQLTPLPPINDVVIVKTQQKNKNFLQGDYTLYHIKLNPCGHVFEKKFNDFRKLRLILHKLYPHIRLPYLEPEGWLVNSSEAKDQDTLVKYKYMVVEFVKYILIRNQTLKKSKIVRIFAGLIESNPAQFKKYENIARPKVMKDLCLPNGQIKFPRYQSLIPIDKFMTNTHLLLGQIDLQYEKLKKSLDILFYNYEHVSKSLLEVAGIFESLESLIQKFNFDNDNKKQLRVYQGIKEVCMHMKDSINGQYQTFKTKIQPLFKFQRDNMMTLKEINDIRGKMFTEYIKQGLHTKKPDPNKIKQSPIVVQGNMGVEDVVKNNKNQLTVQNMFWGHYSVENAYAYWSQFRYKINQQLTLMAYDQLDSENENLNFWNTVIKKCVI